MNRAENSVTLDTKHCSLGPKKYFSKHGSSEKSAAGPATMSQTLNLSNNTSNTNTHTINNNTNTSNNTNTNTNDNNNKDMGLRGSLSSNQENPLSYSASRLRNLDVNISDSIISNTESTTVSPVFNENDYKHSVTEPFSSSGEIETPKSATSPKSPTPKAQQKISSDDAARNPQTFDKPEIELSTPVSKSGLDSNPTYEKISSPYGFQDNLYLSAGNQHQGGMGVVNYSKMFDRVKEGSESDDVRRPERQTFDRQSKVVNAMPKRQGGADSYKVADSYDTEDIFEEGFKFRQSKPAAAPLPSRYSQPKQQQQQQSQSQRSFHQISSAPHAFSKSSNSPKNSSVTGRSGAEGQRVWKSQLDIAGITNRSVDVKFYDEFSP